MRGGPVYIVKPKYIFKHPFNKYDLANPTNRETQNQQLTDYFNYGFNEDTMNIYGKLVKRFIEVLDHHKNLEYFNEPSELMRLNDEIPMDFGGFCKFHDPSIVDNGTPENFHNGQTLMKYFIMMIFANVSRKIQYPLIQFIQNMYKKEGEEDSGQDTALFDIIEQIGKNLEKKYQETMERLYEKQNQSKAPALQKKGPKDDRKQKQNPRDNRQKDRGERGDRDRGDRGDRGERVDREDRRDRGDRGERDRVDKDRDYDKNPQKQKLKTQIKQEKLKSISQQDSDSDDSDDSSSSNEQAKKKKKQRGERSKSDEKSRRKGKKKDKQRDRKKKDNKDKDKKQKHKTKKVKKEKSHKRSRSRDKKKRHH